MVVNSALRDSFFCHEYSGVQQKHPIRLGSQINFDIMSSWSFVQFDDGNHPRETAFRPTSEVFEMFLKLSEH